ncbi:MAG TPA: TolC family protein [Anaeromyxobacteraceae bacterium]|nr:TolC family protein [Anaeromyxobacteraceae bacterium]
MVLPSTLLLAAMAAQPGPPPEISLDEALAELDRQNLTLAQARARADEAAAVAREAAAPVLPTLVAGGSFTRNNAGVSVGLGAILPGAEPIVIQPLETWAATGALRLPLVVPQAWFDLAAARGASRAAGASAEAVRLGVRAGFATAAHAVLGVEELVRASERAVESAAELARSAERRRAAGTAPPLDVLKAQTEQVRRESDLARARADLDRARLALGIFLGRPGPVRVAVPAEESTLPGEPGEALVARALSRRPEVAAQAALVQAAEAQVRSAWARLAPQLSATASGTVQDVPFPTGETYGWRAAVELSWTLYDGGFRYGKRREADAALARARAAAEAQRLEVHREVADGVRELGVAKERLRLAEKQRGLAADASGTARRSFEAGVASSLDVIDANDRLYLAEVGLAEARARLAAARIALSRALGEDGAPGGR